MAELNERPASPAWRPDPKASFFNERKRVIGTERCDCGFTATTATNLGGGVYRCNDCGRRTT